LNIRAGKASPHAWKRFCRLLRINHHSVSKISVPDARTITLQPFEKNMLQVIEKAIMVIILVLIQ
jgi:ribosome recycling factor